MREQNIKLFGRKIYLTDHDGGGENSGESSDESNGGGDARKDGVEDQAMDVLDHKITNSSLDSDNDPEAPVIGEKNCKPKLKKPDKILPCPRCNSSETKFCYYNNYNIKQPRHFCKSCQRYWTAGGMMRNVPVGAGKRKSKDSTSQYPHITISDTFLANGFQNIKFEQNGTVLSFGRNSIPIPKSIPPAPPTAPAPLISWTFPWNSTIPAIPIPIPIISPPPYWNSNHLHHSNNTNTTLGKHSRNEEIETTYPPIVVPKTLRIDDPEEAAKSSIWSTLGINVNPDPLRKNKSLFHSLQPKNDKETMAAAFSPLLYANPAALSRSIIYRETS